jgi:hypothetical protein
MNIMKIFRVNKFILIWLLTVGLMPISVEVYEKDFNNYFYLDLILSNIDLYLN